MSISGKDVLLLVAGVLLAMLTDLLWTNPIEKAFRDLTGRAYTAEGKLETVASYEQKLEDIQTRHGEEIETISARLESAERDASQCGIQLAEETTKKEQYWSELLVAERSLENCREFLARNESRLNRTSEATALSINALEAMDLIYSNIRDCFGSFDSIERAFSSMSDMEDESLDEVITCAKGALSGFARAESTYKEAVGPAFNGKIKDLVENDDISSKDFMGELANILSEELLRKKQITSAARDLSASIAQEQ